LQLSQGEYRFVNGRNAASHNGLVAEAKTRAAPAGIPNGGTMSGHGKREKTLKADATRWRNRVRADLASPAGCAAMSEHKLLSVRSVDDVADVIAGRIAAGDALVPCRGSRRRLVAKYLAARGLVEIVGGDLMRPLGARDGELFG